MLPFLFYKCATKVIILIYFSKHFPDYFHPSEKNRPTRQDKPKTAGGTIADNHLKDYYKPSYKSSYVNLR